MLTNQPLCQFGQPAVSACTEENCNQSALICAREECGCHSGHQNCSSMNWSNLLTGIRGKMEKGNKGPLTKVLTIYKNLQKQITIEIEQIQMFVELVGLSVIEKRLMKLVVDKEWQKITPEIVWEVKKTLKNKGDVVVTSEIDNIELAEAKVKNEVAFVIKTMKRFYEKELNQKNNVIPTTEPKFRHFLKTNAFKATYEDPNEPIRERLNEIDFTRTTELHLMKCPKNLFPTLSQFTTLKTINLSSCEIDDSYVPLIYTHLPHANQIILRYNDLTTAGALQLAQKLKGLKLLDIRDNEIQDEDVNQVSQAFLANHQDMRLRI